MAKYTTPAGDSIEPIVRELTSLREQVRDAQRPQGTRLVRSVEQVAAVRAVAVEAQATAGVAQVAAETAQTTAEGAATDAAQATTDAAAADAAATQAALDAAAAAALATDAATGPVDGGRIVDATLPGAALVEGSLDDFPITGGNIQTSALPNRGTKITDAGLVSYDDDGTAIVALSGTGAAFRGDFQSGSGSSIFKATDVGIQLGDPIFADAPFSVTAAGQMKATDATIGGTIYSAEGDKRSELSSGELIFFGENDGYSWVSMDVDPVTAEPRLSIEAGVDLGPGMGGRSGITVGEQTSQIVAGTDPLSVGMKAGAAEVFSLYNSHLDSQEAYIGAAFPGPGVASTTSWVQVYQGKLKFIPAGVQESNTSNPQIAPVSGGLEVKAPTVQVTGNASVSGTLQAIGTSTLASVNAGNTQITGTATVSSTLGVTGATTLTGNLNSNGTSALKNTTVTGTLGVTSNTTVGGTLAVTGTSTLGTVVSNTIQNTAGGAAAPYAIASGVGSNPGAAVGTVVFPTGRFTVAPMVTVTGATTIAFPVITARSATSFTVGLFSPAGTPLGGSYFWTAVQMTSSSAAG